MEREIKIINTEVEAFSTVEWWTETVNPLVTKGFIQCHLAGQHIVRNKEICKTFTFLDKVWEIRTIHMDAPTFGRQELCIFQVQMLSNSNAGKVVSAKIRPRWRKDTNFRGNEKNYKDEFSGTLYFVHYTFGIADYEFIRTNDIWTLEIELKVKQPYEGYTFCSDVIQIQEFVEVQRHPNFAQKNMLKLLPCSDCDTAGIHVVRDRIYPVEQSAVDFWRKFLKVVPFMFILFFCPFFLLFYLATHSICNKILRHL